jgi:hypothetical protein
VTLGLWASEEVRFDWAVVQTRTSGQSPVLLGTTDGAALLDPGFSPPVLLFLVRGHFRPEELARKVAQVREAEAVVVANPAPGQPWFDEWPEFADALQGHRRVSWSSPRVRLYRRKPARE